MLLESEPGRQLLQSTGLLASALPALQQRCTDATEAALRALGGARAAAGAAALDAAAAATSAACFCARVAMHLAGLATLHVMVDGVEAGKGRGAEPADAGAAAEAAATAAAAGAALMQAAADAGSALASAADALAARGAGGGDGWDDADGAPRLEGAQRELAAGAARLLGLLADTLRMGLLPVGPAEAEQAAGCGRAALGLVAALQPCALEGPAEGECCRGNRPAAQPWVLHTR
jgi:hypothetical protein